MGHIKEPSGINFVVDPTPLTSEDKKKISEIIAHYKATEEKYRCQDQQKSIVLLEQEKAKLPKAWKSLAMKVVALTRTYYSVK